MITLQNPMGTISMTSDYFAELVSQAARSCYGVAGMATGGRGDDLKSLVFGNDFPETIPIDLKGNEGGCAC